MPKKNKLPEYLENLKPEDIINKDNFGPEDTYWPGKNGDLDSEALLQKHGSEWNTNLDLLLTSLIKGQAPDLNDIEFQNRLRVVKKTILSRSERGRSKNDDGNAILEIAWKCHQRMYQENTTNIKDIKLRPIVRQVVEMFYSEVPVKRNITQDSYIEGLEEKFMQNPDLYLSRATRNQEWERTLPFKRLKKIGDQLNALEIPCDTSVFRPRRIKSN